MRTIIIMAGILLATIATAQIGINNPNPDTSAVLDMKFKSSPKGVLVPRMDSLQRQSIQQPGDGLLVYDRQYKHFFFYDTATSSWKALHPWTFDPDHNPSVYILQNVGIGTSNPTEQLEVNGNTKTDTLKSNAVRTGELIVPGFPINALVPAGIITMWSGTIASIPNGWVLCDGQNGTPDLRSRFIVGACCDGPIVPSGQYIPGQTGGSNSVTLSASNLPPHTHNFSGNTNTDGAHTHVFKGNDVPSNNYNGVARAQGSWNFTADVNGTQGTHNHAFSGVTNNGNGLSGQAHENRPPYYALAFIMKLP